MGKQILIKVKTRELYKCDANRGGLVNREVENFLGESVIEWVKGASILYYKIFKKIVINAWEYYKIKEMLCIFRMNLITGFNFT